MINIEVKYRNGLRIAQVYNKWDIPHESSIVYAKDATSEDAGKLLAFDDGSEWFTRILRVDGSRIFTDCGVFNKTDIVTCSRIKYSMSTYDGANYHDHHPIFRGYTNAEMERSTKYISGNRIKLTKREQMLTAQQLADAATENFGIDADWLLKRIIQVADNTKTRGADRLEAIKILSRIAGAEIGTPIVGKNNIPLFGNLTVLSIQDKRRSENQVVHTTAEITDVVNEVLNSTEGTNDISE